ncbi:MAG: ferrous iron transport protein A [Kiritimatiellae bacterium]|nr:ferrous iron transport protein A [Kiritimatiellia bacterium]
MEQICLTDMKNGQGGCVCVIPHGRGVRRRLMELGIRPGANLVKVSSTPGRGPVVVQVGRTQASMGFGISTKVFVEVG